MLLGYARVAKSNDQDPQRREAIRMIGSGPQPAAEVARLFKVHPATVSGLIGGSDEDCEPQPIERSVVRGNTLKRARPLW